MIHLYFLLAWTFFVNNHNFHVDSILSSSTMTLTNQKEIPPDCIDDKGGSDALIFYVSPEMRQSLLSSVTNPETFASKFQDFIRKVRAAFDTEGVVVIRGLLDDELLARLEADSKAIVENRENARGAQTFVSMKFGPVFSDTALREVAIFSAVPRFVALVLLDMNQRENIDADASSLYLLKDAFLAKGGEKKCCGWHVDDAVFWPTIATSKPGVNAWIAIDDIPAKYGGGLAVSPRSHRASWRHRGYKAIGSTQIYPKEGLTTAVAIGMTCNMEGEDPELARIMDESQKVFDFRKGDILFHTRWLFHRSMPITSAGAEHFARLGKEPTFKRYSIRYDYGNSHLLRGFMNMEFAALLNPENKGKTLAEINRDEGLFYPRCYPESMNVHEIEEMDRLVAAKFPLAESKMTEFFAMMKKNLLPTNTEKNK